MLSDIKVHARLRLSALWVAVMLLYIYGDLFGFFEQKTLAEIVAGQAGFIGTQQGLLAAAVVIAAPSVMVVLSLVLHATASRWANIVLGLVYTLIIVVTMPGAWVFYQFLGVVEAVLTLVIAWTAFKWPRL